MTDGPPRWCILRTSGGQTLPLMRSLRDEGFDVWSPARTIRKILRPGTRTEKRIETDVPILPTFVFARERDLAALADVAGRSTGSRPEFPIFCSGGRTPCVGDRQVIADASVQSVRVHPAFSIFCHGGKVPLIGDHDVAGLRGEEERAAATMQAMRDAETITSEAARRRAERAQCRRFEPGAEVRVKEMAALVGVTGVVQSNDGAFAWVCFGTQAWKIEAWRLSPFDLMADTSALRGIAA
jgi:hypothetical protein